jgi:anti-anti-sigma factor
MEYKIRNVGKAVIIDLTGDMKGDEHYAVFKSAVDESLKKGMQHIILNFKNVNYINSSGLGRILLTAKKLSASGGNLKVINLSENLKELFDFTKVSEKISVYDSEEEALKSIG